MRRRTRETLTAILAFGGPLAAITAPAWVNPPWLGLVLAVIGWAVYAYLILGQAILFGSWSVGRWRNALLFQQVAP